MTAPLGHRTCPALGCSRRVHVTDDGTVWARCLAHGLALLHESFTAPATGPDRGVPPVLRSGPVAASVRRPAA